MADNNDDITLEDASRKEFSQQLFKEDKVVTPPMFHIPKHAIKRFVERVGHYKVTNNQAVGEIYKTLSEHNKKCGYLGKELDKDHGLTYFYSGKYNNIDFVLPVSYMGCVYTVLTKSMAKYSVKDLFDRYTERYNQWKDVDNTEWTNEPSYTMANIDEPTNYNNTKEDQQK